MPNILPKRPLALSATFVNTPRCAAASRTNCVTSILPPWASTCLITASSASASSISCPTISLYCSWNLIIASTTAGLGVLPKNRAKSIFTSSCICALCISSGVKPNFSRSIPSITSKLIWCASALLPAPANLAATLSITSPCRLSSIAFCCPGSDTLDGSNPSIRATLLYASIAASIIAGSLPNRCSSFCSNLCSGVCKSALGSTAADGNSPSVAFAIIIGMASLCSIIEPNVIKPRWSGEAFRRLIASSRPLTKPSGVTLLASITPTSPITRLANGISNGAMPLNTEALSTP